MSKPNEAIEEAAALCDVNPNLGDWGVMEHIEFVTNVSPSYHSALWFGIMAAYNCASATKGYECYASIAGFDISPR